jgi:hypothetical protein
MVKTRVITRVMGGMMVKTFVITRALSREKSIRGSWDVLDPEYGQKAYSEKCYW